MGKTGDPPLISSFDERVYFADADAGIYITNKRAVLQGSTYVMQTVCSVALVRFPARRRPGFMLILLGLLLATYGAMLLVEQHLILGFLLALVGALGAIRLQDNYAVRLSLASGEVQDITITDGEYASDVVHAMDRALIEERIESPVRF